MAGRVVGEWLGWGWAWATLKRKLVYSKMERYVSTEKMNFRMSNINKQFLFISFLRV